MNDVLKTKFLKTGNALNRLHAVLQRSAEDDVMIDASIQRFEFTIGLLWKLLRAVLIEEGINDLEYPKKILIKAYSAGLIQDEKLWLDMLNDRNETSNVYDEEKAKEIYRHIQNYYPVMQATHDRLAKKYSSPES